MSIISILKNYVYYTNFQLKRNFQLKLHNKELV